MGFLDNSGDIILDAVLTDVGRKKLANGDFRIAKFAVGDDEIDYRLFDAQHASGSAYYDLEILQSPVLEAGTKNVSSINYGLTTYSRNDILYLPTLKTNSLISDAVEQKEGLFLKPTDSGTARTLSNNGISRMSLESTGLSSLKSVYIESGLDTNGELPRTVSGKNTYLLNVGLVDDTFHVSCDSRFIEYVSGIAQSDKNKTISMDNTGAEIIPPLSGLSEGTLYSTINLPDFKTYSVSSVKNDIYNYNSADLDLNLSAFNGPRGVFCLINFAPVVDINFALYGKTGQTLYGLSGTFSYVDTTVYVVGTNTGVSIQLPIRIIKQD